MLKRVTYIRIYNYYLCAPAECHYYKRPCNVWRRAAASPTPINLNTRHFYIFYKFYEQIAAHCRAPRVLSILIITCVDMCVFINWKVFKFQKKKPTYFEVKVVVRKTKIDVRRRIHPKSVFLNLYAH